VGAAAEGKTQMTKRNVARKKATPQGLGFLRNFDWPTRRIVYGPENKPQPGSDIDNSPEADEALWVERAYSLPLDKLYELANQQLNVAAQPPREQPTGLQAQKKHSLSDHERKVCGVIQSGTKGPTYCRELHNAGATPPKEWISKDCPGTYPGAYNHGLPWTKRIQDEKYRIRRKAESAGLANYSLTSKSRAFAKPA